MKKFYSLRKVSVLFLLCVLKSLVAQAQTNPAPQSLPYSQNFTALIASSTVYPAGWQGWNLSTTGSSTSFRTIAAISDMALNASSTAATTTEGIHNYNGVIGFLPSATADPALCLAINTTGFSSILMTFNIMTIRNPFVSGTNTRIDQVDLQYRVGTSGVFISVSGIVNGIYQNNAINQTTAVTTPQNSLAKSFTLPATCNNQPVVQLRWVQRDFSGIGTNRASFAVDNIVLCTAALTPTISITGPTAFCTGNNAIYNATISNGGTLPVYSWKKNGTTVGASSSALSIVGLVASDQISCVLTSNLTCISSTTATSNTITIGSVVSSPVINLNSLTDVVCAGAHNGAIDISVSGGTPPYSICWDTTNTVNGPNFGVTVGIKSAGNPLLPFGGIAVGFNIDGIEAKELNLSRGITYSFSVLTSGHPFHISTDFAGGNANFIVTNGQTGAPTTSGTVTFTPNSTHPSLLYYPCQFHAFMGWKINLQSYCVEDLTNLHSGKYSVIVTDANGCTATAQYTVNELPSPVSISAAITNAACSASNGAINLSINGGVPPYSVCWDTVNTLTGSSFGVMVASKTPANPYYLLGNIVGFFINGEEAKELFLVRGINYTFNIFNIGHPWHISTDSVGGSSVNIVSSGQSGAPNDNGIVTFTPNNSHPSLLRYVCANHLYMGYKVNILNPFCTEDLSNLKPGIYSVTVKDANGCLAMASYTVSSDTVPIPVNLNSSTDATCYGKADGTIDLNPLGGTSPYHVSGSGPVFSVIAEMKNHSHPGFGLGGTPEGFTMDGVQGKEITLIRGVTYSFSVLVPGHTFMISTSAVGGADNLGSEVTDGVINSQVSIGTLSFTPNSNHPALLYYQCGIHDYMGGKINIVDQLPDGDLGNCMAGQYDLFITDVNGCTSDVTRTTISEPAPGTFYYDGDGDMYGIDGETALGCIAPLGFAASGGDCDDNNSAVNPAATELCDGLDNNCNGVIDEGCPLTLKLKVYIEGFYRGSGLMNSCVYDLWNGSGIGNNTDPTATDTIRVGLWSPENLANPGPDYSGSAVLHTDGIATLSYPAAPIGTYYIDVEHRNSIETWSKLPVVWTAVFQTYDFTIDELQAYDDGVNPPMKDMAGKFALYSGDVNQDGTIDILDMAGTDNDATVFAFGYLITDCNGDGSPDILDMTIMDNNAVLFLFEARPF